MKDKIGTYVVGSTKTRKGIFISGQAYNVIRFYAKERKISLTRAVDELLSPVNSPGMAKYVHEIREGLENGQLRYKPPMARPLPK